MREAVDWTGDAAGELGRGPSGTPALRSCDLREKAAAGHSYGPCGVGTRREGRLGAARPEMVLMPQEHGTAKRPLEDRINIFWNGWYLNFLICEMGV